MTDIAGRAEMPAICSWCSSSLYLPLLPRPCRTDSAEMQRKIDESAKKKEADRRLDSSKSPAQWWNLTLCSVVVLTVELGRFVSWWCLVMITHRADSEKGRIPFVWSEFEFISLKTPPCWSRLFAPESFVLVFKERVTLKWVFHYLISYSLVSLKTLET